MHRNQRQPVDAVVSTAAASPAGAGQSRFAFEPPAATALYVALVCAVASQLLLAWHLGPLSGAQRSLWSVTIMLCLLLSAPAVALFWAVWRTPADSVAGTGLVAIALAGLIMRVPYFGAGPLLEDDHFRYVLDGAMLAHGLNPYTYAPEALLNGSAPEAYLEIAASGLGAIAQINFPDLRTIYPGGAQLLFALAHLIKPWSVDGLRVVLMVCEALTASMALGLLGRAGLPRHLVALIWCNPLLAFSLTGQAHIDAALGPCILAAVLAVRQHAGTVAGAAIGFAIGIKLWPALLAPLMLRSLCRDRRAMIGFVASVSATALIACAAVANAALTPQSGLVAYARGWHMNNMPYEWVSYAGYVLAGGAGLEPYLRSVVAVLSAILAIGLALRPIADAADLIKRLALVAAMAFYLSPAQFPWYAAWFLPLAVLSRNWALVAASASLPAYFLFFPLAGAVWGDLHRYYWLSGLHLLPVIAIALASRLTTRSVAA